MNTIQAIILAGGKGTRMNQGKASTMPKVLYPLADKPMISYILGTLDFLEFNQPIIVVGYKGELVKKTLGNKYTYIKQTKRLGTGHAAKLGLGMISKCFSDALIVNGDDSAFYSQKMLNEMFRRHKREKAVLTFLTTKIPGLTDYGRVIRNEKGEIVDVVEKENMTEAQRQLTEINCAAYLMNLNWAKKNINKIKKNYKGGKEYPLPDVIKLAIGQKKKVIGMIIPSDEWVGINNQEQLTEANKLMKGR